MRLGPGGFHLHPHVRAGEWAAGLPPQEIRVPPGDPGPPGRLGGVQGSCHLRWGQQWHQECCVVFHTIVQNTGAACPQLPGEAALHWPCVIEGGVCPRTSDARASPQKPG